MRLHSAIGGVSGTCRQCRLSVRPDEIGPSHRGATTGSLDFKMILFKILPALQRTSIESSVMLWDEQLCGGSGLVAAMRLYRHGSVCWPPALVALQLIVPKSSSDVGVKERIDPLAIVNLSYKETLIITISLLK